MGEYRNGKWTPTFGDEQFGVVDRPGEMYNRVRELEAEIERLRELNDRSMSVCQHLSISGSTKGMNKVFCASCQAEYWIPSAALGIHT